MATVVEIPMFNRCIAWKFFMFYLLFYVPVNSYGHVEMVS